jgi:hypothetical protein
MAATDLDQLGDIMDSPVLPDTKAVTGILASPIVQKIVQFLPVMVLMGMQLYTAIKGPTKGPKKTVQEASDPSDPRVFFDITIGGEPAGRIEGEPSSTW